jgi:hypothetical protein
VGTFNTEHAPVFASLKAGQPALDGNSINRLPSNVALSNYHGNISSATFANEDLIHQPLFHSKMVFTVRPVVFGTART